MTPCTHVYTLFNSAGRQYHACIKCGAPKPPEPCYFSERGEADRKAQMSLEDMK